MYLLRDFDQILTLQSAGQKSGRRINNEDLSILEKSSIIVEKDKVLWVGSIKKLPKELKRLKFKEINYRGFSVLPGFLECHTHSVFSGSRSDEFERRLQGESYQAISNAGGGIQSTVRATQKSTPKELAHLLTDRVRNFYKQGVTTLEVKSGYGLNLQSEIKLLKVIQSQKAIRIVSTFLGPHAVSSEYTSAHDYISDICKNYLPKIKKHKLSNRADIFIEQGFFSLKDASFYFKAAADLGFDLVVHADQLSRMGAFQLGIQHRAKSVDHLLQINEADAKIVAQSEQTAVLLPSSDLYMNLPYPPARALIDAGARVALATDFNPGSSPSQDLALVGLLARVQMKMSLPEIISAYTVGASFALGLEAVAGQISPGFSADFHCIQGHWTELFYKIGDSPTYETWSRGKCIFKRKS